MSTRVDGQKKGGGGGTDFFEEKRRTTKKGRAVKRKTWETSGSRQVEWNQDMAVNYSRRNHNKEGEEGVTAIKGGGEQKRMCRGSPTGSGAAPQDLIGGWGELNREGKREYQREKG